MESTNVKFLKVFAGVRYWEDSTINGVKDSENGDLIPCKDGKYWKPIIDVEKGQITNWEKGKVAEVHYKVCDDGIYKLYGENDKFIGEIDGYVCNCMCPKEENDGDYIIMDIDENGFIKDWEADFSDFFTVN